MCGPGCRKGFMTEVALGMKRAEMSAGDRALVRRRAWQPTPVFLPGKFPWTEEPAGLQSRGSRESDTTERLSTVHTQPWWTRGHVIGPLES